MLDPAPSPLNLSADTADGPVHDGTVRVARVALVGVHGYGARHLDNLRRLEAGGTARLVAVADPRPPAEGTLGSEVGVFENLEELLAAGVAPDVVVIATPIQAHAPLAHAAIAAGADVYVEKPPVASMEQYVSLLTAAEKAGVAVQTGFQSLGSAALDRLDDLVASGTLGSVRGVSALGAWVRTRGYFARSRWAGKRTLDGVDVVDGVATNPLAHAVATALRVAGARQASDVATVETDLYRAHDIECDDTSAIRVRTASGTVVTLALTLCAAEQTRPSVTLHGTQGTAVLYYTADELEVTTAAGTTAENFGRADLLENLLRHRVDGSSLISPLSSSGAFMRVLDAVRLAPSPHPIDPAHVTWEGDGEDAHPVVKGIEDLLQRACRAQATFTELDPGWARPASSSFPLELSGRAVASYRDGTAVSPFLAPRPYLHPVTTRAGVIVTDHFPADHVWHLGVGVAIQDVNGVNFWGGRTYRREEQAYIWRPDHGRIARTALTQHGDSLEETLRWSGPDGAALLHEARRITWRSVNDAVWALSLEFSLTPAMDGPVHLGSPGSNGREGGGYGGFFWRLPACEDPSITTADASGEAGVHGTVSDWLCWQGIFDGRPTTLLFLPNDNSLDPWFVRAEGYPGVGLALAWDRPVTTTRESPLTRSVTVLIADGALAPEAVRAFAATERHP
jgi:predicted dehydrogenase